MYTRTDALVSQQETGKITASIIPVMSGCHPALVHNDLRAAQFRGHKGRGIDAERRK
jgi:hypothetical protein